jgi:hypothetical protein
MYSAKGTRWRLEVGGKETVKCYSAAVFEFIGLLELLGSIGLESLLNKLVLF